MRTRLFIFLLLSMGLCACNTQRRAQRRIRRIMEQCPELVAIQAHPIDTFLPVPSLADTAIMPLAPILEGQTVTVTTDQGTFTASATNDSLTVTYEAEPEPIHYEDTLHYSQVVIEEPTQNKKPPNYVWFLLGMVTVLLAIVITIIIVVVKKVKAS